MLKRYRIPALDNRFLVKKLGIQNFYQIKDYLIVLFDDKIVVYIDDGAFKLFRTKIDNA